MAETAGPDRDQCAAEMRKAIQAVREWIALLGRHRRDPKAVAELESSAALLRKLAQDASDIAAAQRSLDDPRPSVPGDRLRALSKRT